MGQDRYLRQRLLILALKTSYHQISTCISLLYQLGMELSILGVLCAECVEVRKCFDFICWSLLLGQLVDYFDRADQEEEDNDNNQDKKIVEGIILLVTSNLANGSVFLITQFNIRATLLETEIKGALMLAVFRNASLQDYIKKDR